MPEIILAGCTPEPLMSYLKALGVFRLVAEQADSTVRGCWSGGVFELGSKFNREELTKFFEESYQPTPVIVPWSGGDYFGVKATGNPGPFAKAPTATRIIEAFLATTGPRLILYRNTIRIVLRTMEELGITSKATIEGKNGRPKKAAFLARLRSELPDLVVPWLDAAAQLTEDGFTFNPLLGSGGGSDGNSHFSDNFMQNLWDCFADFDTQRSKLRARPSLTHALYGDFAGELTADRTGALFDSGAVGGPNATQGRLRSAFINPWNFVLAIEGCLLFAGGIAKRLSTHSRESPAFPFTVEMTAAGFGSAASKEYGQREVWFPLWHRPMKYSEAELLMREGRAQVGRRPASSGIDFARAVATLGVSAGVDEFTRYGFIRGRVGGENYYTAAALGQFRVHEDSALTLLEQLDPWLDRIRRICADEDTPARYRTALRQLDEMIVAHCQQTTGAGTAGGLQLILCVLGRLERALAVGTQFPTENRLVPLQGLNPAWLDQADDDSPEFRLAASLAGIRAIKDTDIGPFRVHLEPVVVNRAGRFEWDGGSTSAVWSNRSLDHNLSAVFSRRQMEAFRAGLAGVPLHSPRHARLADVCAFLNCEIDDEKLHDLIWGLSLVERQPNQTNLEPVEEVSVPFEFGVPRLLVEPLTLTANRGQWQLGGIEATTPDPDVFHILSSSQPEAVKQCIDRAARRLKSCGRLVVGYRNRGQAGKSLAVVSPIPPTRLLAACLFPLSGPDLEAIANTVLYHPETQE